jgi:hypothetical protein
MQKTPTKYKGIEFVRLRDLPPVQKDLLLNTLGKECIITIQMPDCTFRDCLQFKDYLNWYESDYRRERINDLRKSSAESGAMQPVSLVIN